MNTTLSFIKDVNMVLAFLLELGVLVAWGYWGFFSGSNVLLKLVFGIGIPIVAIIIWALFGSPKATWHLYGPWRLVLGIIFFGSAAVALYLANQRTMGIVFALLFVLNWGLAYAWGQERW